MARDDWKYYEDDDFDEEEAEKPSKEKQCPRCLHWLPRKDTFCSWCGKVFEDRDSE